MHALATWWAGTPWVTRWRALPTARRRQLWAVVLLAVGLAFPFGPVNAGHVDAATNAFIYVLLALGLNVHAGRVVYDAVADEFGYERATLESVLG